MPYPTDDAVKREASDGEDFADRDNDVAKEEELHLPVVCQHLTDPLTAMLAVSNTPPSNGSLLAFRTPYQEQADQNSDTTEQDGAYSVEISGRFAGTRVRMMQH